MEPLAVVMYAEMDVMCMLLLAYIGVKTFSGAERWGSRVLFQWSIFFLFIMTGEDLIWMLMEKKVLYANIPLSYAVNLIYFAASLATSISWLVYTEMELNTGTLHRLGFKIGVLTPVVVEVILLVVNFFNGCIFSFDAEGNYVRGPYTVIVFILPILYIIAASVHAVIIALKPENYLHRSTFLCLASFPLYTIGATILQFLLPGSPLPCVGMSIAIFMTYLNHQEQRVSIDPLTQLNNRHHMMHYLTGRIEHHRKDNRLYLLLMDMDKFKQINDTYGHLEGDHALIQLAQELSHVAAAHSAYAARYGGDEFIIVCEGETDAIVYEIISELNARLAEINAEHPGSYEIRISIGWVEYRPELHYVPDFIASADVALYETKRRKNSGKPAYAVKLMKYAKAGI